MGVGGQPHAPSNGTNSAYIHRNLKRRYKNFYINYILLLATG